MTLNATVSKKRKFAERSTSKKASNPKKLRSAEAVVKPKITTKTTLTKKRVDGSEGDKSEDKGEEDKMQDSILALEEAIVESPKNYNNIVTLQTLFQDNVQPKLEIAVTAAVSLCRTFCRLMAKGWMVKNKDGSEQGAVITLWLKDRYKEYLKSLCSLVNHGDAAVQNTALTLLMRLVKDESSNISPSEEYYFPHDTFAKVARAIIHSETLDEDVRTQFLEKYLDGYDDVRYSFYHAVKLFLDNDQSESENSIDAVVRILVALRTIPTPDAIIGNFFAIARPKKPKSSKLPSIAQLNSHRRAVQELWCAVLRSKSLTTTQCKTILEIAERQIIPTFPKPQLLMDFFIGCYDHGGTTSLLALNGLFHLISTKNLDYPNFFSKLYALLDRNLMHVRYRSRFFRQLDIFLASTHLPAALVASFIKKLARLCLSAPPGAIVIVVPFVYNLFKRHRATTYMMHRPPIDSAEKEDWETDGYKDPFDDQQPDPLHTCAIESCVWELETLTTHWHPNVATLARIIKEQFTKDRYQIEDFLDHSYSSMFNLEITREIKKAPVVEQNIPKKIFFTPSLDETENIKNDNLGRKNLMVELWSF